MSSCLKHSAVVGCWNKANATKESVVIHYTYGVNSSGVEILKATRYTNSNGVPLSIPVGDTVSAGACDLSTVSLTVQSGGVSIASGTFAATLGPDGTIWNNPGNLKSVTVRARRSNNNNAIPGSGANQVMVQTTNIKVILLTNESATWSVEDGNIQDLVYVECLANSAALVIYNFI